MLETNPGKTWLVWDCQGLTYVRQIKNIINESRTSLESSSCPIGRGSGEKFAFYIMPEAKQWAARVQAKWKEVWTS